MAITLYDKRQLTNIAAQVLATAATIFGLFWLVWIIWTTLRMGLSSLNLALFTEMTPPPGSSGGMLNAFFGSALLSLLGIFVMISGNNFRFRCIFRCMLQS